VLNFVVRLVLAGISIIIGIAGLILPVLPGWLFFGIAALLLFPNTKFAQRIFTKIENRFPSTKRLLRFLTRDGAS
jgi:uncharacterized membrane protein YbaN (DUF454 family)